jgi:DNA helicase-2/ATP-dependent DNA helicase PcrA
LEALKNKYSGLEVVGVEEHVNIPLNSMVKYEYDDLTFDGTIDVLLKHDSGYLMVDWKTNKREDTAEHRRQLSVYKKIYAIDKKIPEDKITTCLIYVALRGGVNTGRFGKNTYFGDKDAKVFKTFEKHLQIVLGWKKDPAKFIKELLERPTTDPLLVAIKDKLANEMK